MEEGPGYRIGVIDKTQMSYVRFNPTVVVIPLNVNVLNSTIKRQEWMNNKDLTLC